MTKLLFLRVFVAYALIIVFLGGAVALLAPGLMREHHYQEQSDAMEHLGLLLEGRVVPFLLGGGSGDLEAYVLDIGRRTSTRITVIGRDGQVLADSERSPKDMENHLYRPEINEALQGRKRMSIRHSSTLDQDMMYMSLPLQASGKVVGVLRLSLYLTDLDLLFDRLRADLLKTLGLVTALALVAAFFFTRSLSRPIKEFAEVSTRVAGGDFNAKVSVRQRGEFKNLALSFNAMTRELKRLFEETRLRGEEQDIILGSIRDGLCVMDGESRIVVGNAVFRRIVQNDQPVGKHYWEVIRSSKFAQIVKQSGLAPSAAAGEIELGERVYSCSITFLPARERYVVILSDITPPRGKPDH